jgi:hypothetical protein
MNANLTEAQWLNSVKGGLSRHTRHLGFPAHISFAFRTGLTCAYDYPHFTSELGTEKWIISVWGKACVFLLGAMYPTQGLAQYASAVLSYSSP